MILEQNRLVDRWFIDNNIDARWVNDMTFWVGDTRFLYLRHKEGKIFLPEFSFIVDDDELAEFMTGDDHKVDYYCFEFGGKVYYSEIGGKPQLRLFKYFGRAINASGFEYLGIHSGFELCSGSRTYDMWCAKASFLGVTALGVCERHTLAGALKFQMACRDYGIKSIIGETLTVAYGDATFRLKVYVANEEGWYNLLRLHKLLNIDHHGKAIPLHDVLSNGRGLYGVIQHDTMVTDALAAELSRATFEGLFFQLDPVQYKAETRDRYCMDCLKRALQLKLPLILLCDSYYLDQEDHRVRQILQFIGNTGFEYQSENQHFKSLEQVAQELTVLFTTKGEDFAYGILQQALDNLQSVVAQCNYSIKLGEIRLPKYRLSEHDNVGSSEELFWNLIEKGLEHKIAARGKNVDVYLKRIEVEYDVISRGGFVDYFLILNDVVRWATKQGILVGIGRGSGAGSLIAYLLDLVKVDPLDYGLLFERFLNEGRIGRSLPDLDTDFAGNRRDEVKRYIEERYGADNVCSIGTYGTFKLKAALRDLCRFKGVEPQSINYYGSMMSESGDELHQLFYDGGQSTQLHKFIDENADVVNNIDLILGQPKNASVHAAGVVITPSDNNMTIYQWMPVKKVDGILISEWEGPELESAGFLKEDILGIRQLDKFSDIFKLIDQNHGSHPEFEEIDYNDPEVLKLFCKGWNQDLFHFGSVGLTSYCQDVQPESMEELIAMIALYRPGAMEFGAHEDYVKIKRGKKKPQYDYMLEEITRPTYGLYCYQEQIMQACQILGGFTLTQADDIRKAMGKKIPEKIKSYKDKFIEGALSRGCPMHEAVQIWSKLEAFAGYGFNKSHAAAYAMTGYFCQYLKYYYPMEFWTVSLQYADDDEIHKRISEIRKFPNITILPPDINKSQRTFTSDFSTNTIYWSLGKIKFAGDAAIDAIIKERERGGEFFSLEEFVSRIDRRVVNKRVVTNLILSGCFDSLHNVQVITQRRALLRQFLNDDEAFAEYDNSSKFFWFAKQKEASRSGYYDYKEAIEASRIEYAPQRYVTPDRILVMENLDKVVVVTGMLTEVIVKKSKNGPFAQLIIDHNNESVEVTMWNESWMKYKTEIQEGINRGIIVLGKIVSDRYKKHNLIHSIDDTVVEFF